MTINVPTLDDLKRALHLRQGIDTLKAELAALFGSSSESKPATGKRRGRKPGSKNAARPAVAAVADSAPKSRGRPRRAAKAASAAAPVASKKSAGRAKKKHTMSAEGRARIAEAQRKRWAAQKKNAKKAAKSGS